MPNVVAERIIDVFRIFKPKWNSLQKDTNREEQTSVDKEKRSLRCGLLNLRPHFLQKFNSARWFFAFFCLAFLVHHMTNTMISVNLSTIEKRFDLSSTKSSFIINAYDISCAATVMFISHFCKNSKPKWIGIGIVVMGIGALIFTIPHVAETNFFTIKDDMRVTLTDTGLAPIDHGRLIPGSDSAICSASNVHPNSTTCPSEGVESSSKWYFIFVIGALLFGLGGTPINTLGPPFLDEIFPPTKVTAFYGVMGSMSCLGPIFGFAFGGFMLKYYVDFSEPEGLTPSDSEWIGAWWTGFILSGIMAVLSAIPLIMFPRKLPEADEVLTMKIAAGIASPETNRESENSKEKMTVLEMALEFWPTIKTLFSNGPYMCCTLSQAFTGFLIGACSFLPKLVQIGLKFEPSQASFYLGTVLVSAAGGGYLIGGYLSQKLKMDGKSAAKYGFIFSIFGAIPSFGMLMHCPGVVMGEASLSSGVSLASMHPLDPGYAMNMCADSCKCPTDYDPVCGQDMTFSSPCHAGCTVKELIDEKYYKFSNCSCLMTDEIIVGLDNASYHATSGKCETDCPTYVPVMYLGSAFLTLFFCFLAQPASMLALNRSVSHQHLSMAYGIRNLLFRTLGTIPGPVLFGIIIDSACAVWQRGCDGSYGSCWEHDTTKLVYSVSAAFIVVKILSDVFLFLTWRLYPESSMYSPTPTPEDNPDAPPDYVVKVTDDSELLEITYRNQERRGSAHTSNRKRLSDYLKSGLENGGKIFVSMAHETIV
ncbi:solute carrier organic anion transporter family member 4A1-like isoform X2 [Bolinopsis microptera]|uniref:solute carrier organic anion transporter family member 4A1-like isoform X2 n=1 Tax=Bolinopsis microptera TaxID=2820187 RepID=UPI003078C23D